VDEEHHTQNDFGDGVITGVMLLLLVALIVLIGAYVWPLFEAVAQ
jgi:hypothetical protein